VALPKVDLLRIIFNISLINRKLTKQIAIKNLKYQKEMTHSQIVEKLENEDICPSSYCINSTPKEYKYCFFEKEESYEVFYLERGMKFEHELFSNRKEAVNYFVKLLVSNPFTRK